jgi:acyl-CoA thioesterase-1
MKTLLALVVAASVHIVACADPIKIVAFGGSNKFGKNLSRASAYPAQLESLLRAKGHDVIVVNEGTNGQTTSDEVSGLNSAIPPDAKIVIFQPGGNDRRKGSVSDTKTNIETVVRQLQERGILVIFSGGKEKRAWVESFDVLSVDELNNLAPGELQLDGQHRQFVGDLRQHGQLGGYGRVARFGLAWHTCRV